MSLASLRRAYPFKAPSTSADHIVIGGGVLGLAVAAGLVNTAGRGRTTFLVERRKQLWQNDSKRKSDVIQCGVYYPVGSLKSQLCIRGRDLLYNRCKALGIDHRKSQKLVVATANAQIEYLDHLQTLSLDPRLRQGSGVQSSSQNDSSIPAYFLSGDDAREMEPDLSSSVRGAVILTETGIISRQGLIESLEKEVEEEEYLSSSGPGKVGVGVGRRVSGKGDNRGDGVIVRDTRVVRIDPDAGGGWVVQLESGWNGEEQGEVEAVRAEVVVNAAGWDGVGLMEGVVPESERLEMNAISGQYLSYKGPGTENISRIIHPCPTRHTDGISARLSIGVDDEVHFGPSFSYLDNPTPSPSELENIGRAIQDYLPDIDPSLLQPAYTEIRASPSRAGDCMIRHVQSRKGLIELIGFDSPLTPALAVGEAVAEKIRREIWRGGKQIDELAKGWE